MKAFDPNHPRCIFPRYGAAIDAAMHARGLSSEDVAKSLRIDGSSPRAWRRGFGRNDPTRRADLEALLGVKLPMDEPVPSQAKKAAQAAAQPDPVLPHLAAIAMAHGFRATFVPL